MKAMDVIVRLAQLVAQHGNLDVVVAEGQDVESIEHVLGGEMPTGPALFVLYERSYDMPGEDDLAEALLKAARVTGQVQREHICDESFCCSVCGRHATPHRRCTLR